MMVVSLGRASTDDDIRSNDLIAAGAGRQSRQPITDVTPLAVACTNGNAEIVEQLLAAGADPNGSLPGGETALMTAARTGRLGSGEALLRPRRRRQRS